MRGLNRLEVIGRLGQDPETRSVGERNTTKCTFSVATTEPGGKDRPDVTEWHNCEAWGKLGENISKYARKGSLVYASGPIRTREYQGKDGGTRKFTAMNVEEFRLLEDSSRGDQRGGGYRDEPRGEPEPRRFQQPPAPAPVPATVPFPNPAPSRGNDDDSFPF